MSIVSCVDDTTGTLCHGNKLALWSLGECTVISMTTSLKSFTAAISNALVNINKTITARRPLVTSLYLSFFFFFCYSC